MALVGTKEAARQLGLSEDTLKRWASAGKVPAYRVGRCFKFDVDELRGHFRHRVPEDLKTPTGLRNLS